MARFNTPVSDVVSDIADLVGLGDLSDQLWTGFNNNPTGNELASKFMEQINKRSINFSTIGNHKMNLLNAKLNDLYRLVPSQGLKNQINKIVQRVVKSMRDVQSNMSKVDNRIEAAQNFANELVGKRRRWAKYNRESIQKDIDSKLNEAKEASNRIEQTII